MKKQLSVVIIIKVILYYIFFEKITTQEYFLNLSKTSSFGINMKMYNPNINGCNSRMLWNIDFRLDLF